MQSPLRSAVLVALALAPPALAESPGRSDRGTSTPDRLVAASYLRTAGPGLLSIGGSELRHLPKGAKKWKRLHTQPRDNLYRVAVDDGGTLAAAAWERDPFVRVFDLSTGAQVKIAKPHNPGHSSIFQVDTLAFAPD